MVQPPALTSTTMVLLPTPALADSSSSDVATQVHIALSTTVLEQAGQAIAPPLPARSVEKMVDVSAPTNQLIQIDATSTSAAEAQTLSQAVADSYVGYVSDTAREVSSAALADLKLRRDELQAQIEQLQDDIAAATKRQQAVDPDSPAGLKRRSCLPGFGPNRPTWPCSWTRSRKRSSPAALWVHPRPSAPRSSSGRRNPGAFRPRCGF